MSAEQQSRPTINGPENHLRIHLDHYFRKSDRTPENVLDLVKTFTGIHNTNPLTPSNSLSTPFTPPATSTEELATWSLFHLLTSASNYTQSPSNTLEQPGHNDLEQPGNDSFADMGMDTLQDVPMIFADLELEHASLSPQSPYKTTLDAYLDTNPTFKTVHLVLQWIQDLYNHTLGYPHYPSSSKYHQETTRQLLSRTTSANHVLSLDPDAVNRSGRALHVHDAIKASELYEAVLRCVQLGDLVAAKHACLASGFGWLAAVIDGGQIYQDLSYPAVDARPKQSVGNPNLRLWKYSCYKASIALTNTASSLVTLYSIFGSNLNGALSEFNRFEDILWALSYITFHNMLLKKIEAEHNRHADLDYDQPCYADNDFIAALNYLADDTHALELIFDHLRQTHWVRFNSEFLSFFQYVQYRLIVLNDLSDVLYAFVPYILDQCAQFENLFSKTSGGIFAACDPSTHYEFDTFAKALTLQNKKATSLASIAAHTLYRCDNQLYAPNLTLSVLQFAVHFAMLATEFTRNRNIFQLTDSLILYYLKHLSRSKQYVHAGIYLSKLTTSAQTSAMADLILAVHFDIEPLHERNHIMQALINTMDIHDMDKTACLTAFAESVLDIQIGSQPSLHTLCGLGLAYKTEKLSTSAQIVLFGSAMSYLLDASIREDLLLDYANRFLLKLILAGDIKAAIDQQERIRQSRFYPKIQSFIEKMDAQDDLFGDEFAFCVYTWIFIADLVAWDKEKQLQISFTAYKTNFGPSSQDQLFTQTQSHLQVVSSCVQKAALLLRNASPLCLILRSPQHAKRIHDCVVRYIPQIINSITAGYLDTHHYAHLTKFAKSVLENEYLALNMISTPAFERTKRLILTEMHASLQCAKNHQSKNIALTPQDIAATPTIEDCHICLGPCYFSLLAAP